MIEMQLMKRVKAFDVTDVGIPASYKGVGWRDAMTAGIRAGLIGLGVVVVAGLLMAGGGRMVMGTVMGATQATRKEPIPAPALDETQGKTKHETAVFAGGCFWGVQTTFQRIKGVTATTAGYSGGSAETANYGAVSSETTQHAESVKVVFDPARISYGTLLRIFFSVVHDPTQLNRQGPDVGTSYRSVIFYTTPEQQKIAAAYIAQLDAAHVFPRKIVTEVTPLKAFYDAEDYHQDYAEKNPNNPYIQVCDVPKVAALKEQFPELFQDYKHK
jgi:peptide-methionine (S)-S-oxide reductase